MDLKYLHTFKTVTEEGSFIRAAERLNYTQSTITFQINQLEKDLSIKLFEKIGRKMVLTKAGESLIPYVDDVLFSLDKLKNFDADLSGYSGDLHVGVGETLLCYKVPRILRKFREEAPKAQLFLRSMNCYDIRDELMTGALDIGIFYDYVGGFGTSLKTHAIDTYGLALLASPEMRDRFPDFITADQQIPVSFIINEPTCVFRQIFEQYLRKKSIMLDHTIEMWSITTIKNLVKNNVGITFLPRFAAAEELKADSLVEIRTELTDMTIAAVCGYHKNKWVSPLMDLFISSCATIQ